MPWKGERNPYLVWLSEIILQQTRVEQGLPYYERFRERFPTVTDLANAPEDEVMKLWEGLGYYSRARNLHSAARYIAEELKGVFPSTYSDILALKGVGPYTAAAIASFAFDLPQAVVDGNVYRVLSRYFGIATPIDSGAGKKEFAQLAQMLLDTNQPAIYNQAIIDFGAVQCKPKQPLCADCPLQENCVAYREERINDFPVKSKKIKKRLRYFNYLVISDQEGALLLQKRSAKDIWQNLYEFPLIESEELLDQEAVFRHERTLQLTGAYPQLNRVSRPFQQVLTHQKITARFWELSAPEINFSKKSGLISTPRKKLRKFAFPKIIDWYLQDKSLYLELL